VACVLWRRGSRGPKRARYRARRASARGVRLRGLCGRIAWCVLVVRCGTVVVVVGDAKAGVWGAARVMELPAANVTATLFPPTLRDSLLLLNAPHGWSTSPL
jgi:hypothetical protein